MYIMYVIMTCVSILINIYFFFFNDTATTEIYTLSLHDALPICHCVTVVYSPHRLDEAFKRFMAEQQGRINFSPLDVRREISRSEEHTSELQSRQYLVCRLLLEKKK